MRRSWLTAASALAAVAAEATPASAQLFSAPGTVDFGDTLVGSSSSRTFDIDVLGAITSGDVSGAMAPFSGGPVSLVSSVKAEVRATYDFAPVQRGDYSQGVKVSAEKLGIVQAGVVTLQGVGVAPVESLSVSASPVVRIGTSGLQTVTVSNIGDGNLSGLGDRSDLVGHLGGGFDLTKITHDSTPAVSVSGFGGPGLSSLKGGFTGPGGKFDLADGAEASFAYKFTPTDHGVFKGGALATFANGSADGTNQAGSEDVFLSGEGVGPKYSSSVAPGGVIDLGTIKLGATDSMSLKIGNLSKDLKGALPELTDLSLLGADLSFAGPDAPFSVGKFVPGTVLREGKSFDLKIDFGADTLGVQTATLAIVTDQDSAFGSLGQTFDYRLTADVVPSAVPEAGTWEMLLAGFGLLGLQYRRGRKSPRG